MVSHTVANEVLYTHAVCCKLAILCLHNGNNESVLFMTTCIDAFCWCKDLVFLRCGSSWGNNCRYIGDVCIQYHLTNFVIRHVVLEVELLILVTLWCFRQSIFLQLWLSIIFIHIGYCRFGTVSLLVVPQHRYCN